jgi:hypothetical protein
MRAVKPPHSLEDMNLLRTVLTQYAEGNAAVVAALIANVYILMLSFAIPGEGLGLALTPGVGVGLVTWTILAAINGDCKITL